MGRSLNCTETFSYSETLLSLSHILNHILSFSFLISLMTALSGASVILAERVRFPKSRSIYPSSATMRADDKKTKRQATMKVNMALLTFQRLESSAHKSKTGFSFLPPTIETFLIFSEVSSCRQGEAKTK